MILGVYKDADVSMRTHVTNTIRADKLCWPWSMLSWSAKLTTVYFSPSRHFRKSSESVAVSTERRRSARMFSQEVRAHNPTALRTSLVACSRAHHVPVVCWLTAVCTTQHQPTLLIVSSRLPTPLHVVVCALPTRWRCKCRRRDALPSATRLFQWWQFKPGTVCHLQREPPTNCCCFGERQKCISFGSRFWTDSCLATNSLTLISLMLATYIA